MWPELLQYLVCSVQMLNWLVLWFQRSAIFLFCLQTLANKDKNLIHRTKPFNIWEVLAFTWSLIMQVSGLYNLDHDLRAGIEIRNGTYIKMRGHLSKIITFTSGWHQVDEMSNTDGICGVCRLTYHFTDLVELLYRVTFFQTAHLSDLRHWGDT